jgi:hypothetical protein
VLKPDLPRLIVPRYGERVAALGNSGEGKTQLLRQLFLAIEDGIFVDTKHDEPNSDLGLTISGNKKIYEIDAGRYVWRAPESFVFDEDERERFYRWCLKAGRRVILIDEFADSCPSAQSYPRALKMCVMRGRSRKLSIWGTTQEPLRVPPFLFGQAQHLYCFHLGHPRQRDLAQEFFEDQRIPWQEMPSHLEVGHRSPLAHRFIYRGTGGIFGPTKLLLPTREGRTSEENKGQSVA